MIYHVLNRAAGRRHLFDDDEDYLAFLRVFSQALSRPAGTGSPGPVRVLSYCLMPNHAPLSLSKGGTSSSGRGATAACRHRCSG